MNTCNTSLDDQLRELALTDWPKFVSLLGIDNIERAKVCLMRSKKKSIRSIANNLRSTKSKVSTACKKCPNL